MAEWTDFERFLEVLKRLDEADVPVENRRIWPEPTDEDLALIDKMWGHLYG